ncbi:MAG TPA: type II toxin-antitoxin system RelE/ParE family toxin [Limnobacter sp.]|uniref:type II toxin-antitoxin system RelE/ParE family toxin n=1 Tax=Limnobacter sp. TaxID=2003368 RepID=UPI002ED7DB1A
MTKRVKIKLTANFERNLADIEQFLTEAEVPHVFDDLVDELLATVLPNLEQFPELGAPFLNRAVGSAEASNATAALKAKLAAVAGNSLNSLREYVMNHYLVLYVRVEGTLFLLSIKHHKQLSFDFEGHWGTSL